MILETLSSHGMILKRHPLPFPIINILSGTLHRQRLVLQYLAAVTRNIFGRANLLVFYSDLDPAALPLRICKQRFLVPWRLLLCQEVCLGWLSVATISLPVPLVA